MKLINYVAIMFLTFFNSVNSVNQVHSINKKNALILPDPENEPAVLQIGEKIGEGSNKIEYSLIGYQMVSVFTYNNIKYGANFEIYIKGVISYDYNYYYEPGSMGTYLIVKNYKVQFNYITMYKSMADNSIAPTFLTSDPINSYFLDAVNPSHDRFLCLLEKYDYARERFNTLPSVFNGQTFLEMQLDLSNQNTNQIQYGTSFIYYAKYYDNDKNIYVDFVSNRIRPYGQPSLSGNNIKLNDTIGSSFTKQNVKPINQNKLAGFNNKSVNPGSSSRDPITITAEGFKASYDEGANQYQVGYNTGYNAGYTNGLASAGQVPWLVSIFNTLDNVFNIEIFPGLKIWYIVAIPVIFSLIAFVLSFFR